MLHKFNDQNATVSENIESNQMKIRMPIINPDAVKTKTIRYARGQMKRKSMTNPTECVLRFINFLVNVN